MTQGEFDAMLARKKESAAGTDGLPYSAYRNAGGVGASRTFFIPNSTVANERVRIIRSPEASRPSAICNCDCKVLTTALCDGLRHVFGVLYPLLAEVRSYKTDDRQLSSRWKLRPWPTAHAWPMTAASSSERSFVSCEGRAFPSSYNRSSKQAPKEQH